MAKFAEVLNHPQDPRRLTDFEKKHTPTIESPLKVKAGEPFQVTVTVGKELPHPNTIEHHIKWVQLFADNAHVATADFGPTFASPKATFTVKAGKSVTLIAIGYCNLHGFWESTVDVAVS